MREKAKQQTIKDMPNIAIGAQTNSRRKRNFIIEDHFDDCGSDDEPLHYLDFEPLPTFDTQYFDTCSNDDALSTTSLDQLYDHSYINWNFVGSNHHVSTNLSAPHATILNDPEDLHSLMYTSWSSDSPFVDVMEICG
eukprot:10055395-Karenia_brevis.AAC.1